MITIKKYSSIFLVLLCLQPLSLFAYEVGSNCTTYSPATMINCVPRVLLEARSYIGRGSDGNEFTLSVLNGTAANVLSRVLPYVDRAAALQVPQTVTNGLRDLTKDTLAPTLGAAHIKQVEMSLPLSMREKVTAVFVMLQTMLAKAPEAIRALEKDLQSGASSTSSPNTTSGNTSQIKHTDPGILDSPSFDGNGFITK